ncbi:MAG: class I SAM-dependent methyltransferase [Pirellulales bacterium]
MKLWPNSMFFRMKLLSRGWTSGSYSRLLLDQIFNRLRTSAVSTGEQTLALGTCAAADTKDTKAQPTAASVLPHYRRRPLTCLADAAELEVGNASGFARQMPDDYGYRQLLRKWWEWDYIAKSAEDVGVLNGNSLGVGMGVGNEPLIFYFANHCKKIIATDLYAADASWREARFDHADVVCQTSPIPFPRERVEVRNADMRALGIADASADFAWSCSSIEHVPTLRDLLLVFDELARVLKIGGYAFLTTEFCLSQPPYLLPGVNALDPGLLELLRDSLGAFEFVGVTDLSYNFAYPANAPSARRYVPPGLTRLPCVPIQPAYRWGQVANLVGLSVIAPIAFVLRRREGANAKWKDLRITREVRAFTESVAQLKADRIHGVVRRLQPLVESGPHGLTPQFYHHVFRFYIEAMAKDITFSKHDVTREIAKFMGQLPQGVVHDADCLDMVGYLLEAAGHHEDAARLYKLAMNSPSTSREHVVKLAFDYCRAMKHLGKFGKAVEAAAPVLHDLIVTGSSSDELARLASNRKQCGSLNRSDLHHLQNLVSDLVTQSSTNFKNEAFRCAQSLEAA